MKIFALVVKIFPEASPSSQTRKAMCLFDRSTSLKIGSISITCEKNNIESVCGNSKFSYHFLFPLFFFHWRCPNVHKRCTGAMSEEQEMELEAVCLSRLYFALNRIQGSLQIDKKKKEGNKHFGMFEKSKRYVYKKRQNEKEAQ